MSTDIGMLAPPLQPIEMHEVSADEIIGWLNQHLALYAAEVISLRRQLAHANRKIELLCQVDGKADAA